MPKRQRLDELLVARELAPDLDTARKRILAGEVWRGTDRLTQPGVKYLPDAAIEWREPTGWVSRSAGKLLAALKEWNIPVRGRVAVDIGSSTGGFTQVLLNMGARRVYSVDVGEGLLDVKLRQNPDVCVLEGVNARSWNGDEMLADPPTLLVMDVSFISLRAVLPNALTWMDRSVAAEAIVLLKPQFELPADRLLEGGIVRDEEDVARLRREFSTWEPSPDWRWRAELMSPIKGAKSGNQEWLLRWARS